MRDNVSSGLVGIKIYFLDLPSPYTLQIECHRKQARTLVHKNSLYPFKSFCDDATIGRLISTRENNCETNQQVPVSTLVKAGFSYKDIPAKRIFSVCLQGSKELQVNLANSHFF